ncbi:hypothetical protein DL95DRAFT_471989 [Leptodontidium sp. 2 PMI_412]|nr:hypothetical protein DL95DRAFT_471989 [Leptodontidium sp. 2 PMI_412]
MTGTTIIGKETKHIGNSLEGFQTVTSQDEIDQVLAEPRGAIALRLLSNASTRFVNDHWRRYEEQTPIFNVLIALAKPTHPTPPIHSKSRSDLPSLIDVQGQSVVQRRLASKWKVFNNKGNPVKSFKPFFDDSHRFTADVKAVVSATIIYDPLGRVIGKFYPDHSWSKLVYQPWQLAVFDVNDTVLPDPSADANIGGYVSLLQDDEYSLTWYNSRIDGKMGPEEQAAAQKTAQHANTPSIMQAGSLGRTVVKITDNGVTGKNVYFTQLDIQGNAREMVDPWGRTIERNYYNMVGVILGKDSMEAGTKRKLLDVANAQPSPGTPETRPSRAYTMNSEDQKMSSCQFQELRSQRLANICMESCKIMRRPTIREAGMLSTWIKQE